MPCSMQNTESAGDIKKKMDLLACFFEIKVHLKHGHAENEGGIVRQRQMDLCEFEAS